MGCGVIRYQDELLAEAADLDNIEKAMVNPLETKQVRMEILEAT